MGDFTFGEKALGHTFRLEAYLYEPEGGVLIITPKLDKIPRISKVELFYVDDSRGDTFSFMEKLRARVYTVNLFDEEVVFTLWEDDAKGGGHNKSNTSIATQKNKSRLQRHCRYRISPVESPNAKSHAGRSRSQTSRVLRNGRILQK